MRPGDDTCSSVMPAPKPMRTLNQFRSDDPAGWQIMRHLLRRWNVAMNMPGVLDDSLMHTQKFLNSGLMRYRFRINSQGSVCFSLDFWSGDAYRPCGREVVT